MMSPSISLPVSWIALETSSCVDTDWLFATGASFTGDTVIETVAVFESSDPSFALKVKLSGPL